MELCEKIQRRFMKMLLQVRKSTPTSMVLGELGSFPVSIEAKYRMLTYWYKLSLADITGSSRYHSCESDVKPDQQQQQH